MVKHIPKTILILLGVILFFGMLFFLYKIFTYHKVVNIETAQSFTQPQVLYGNETCYIQGEYLYVTNTETGTMHIFNKNGEFKKGFQLPTNGGDVWIGLKNSLYVYCVRTELLFEINNMEITTQNNVYYNNPNTFYNSLNLTGKQPIILKKNTIIITKDNYKSKIILDIDTNFLSFDVCVLSYVIFLFTFLYIKRKQRQGDGSTVLK